MISSDSEAVLSQNIDNPFLSQQHTPFQVPPFEMIKTEHYLPAFEAGIKEQKQRIAHILAQSSEPSFENTIAGLEQSGELLKKVSTVFFNLSSANTSPEMEKIAQEIAPKLSQHGDDIYLNPDLFQKVKALNDQVLALHLNNEQSRLLELTYKAFVRSGANLNDALQLRMREINQELSVLTVKFGQNLQAETNNFELTIEHEFELAGLPSSLKASALQAGKDAGKEGKWKFSLHNPSIMPFLQYSANRELRKIMYEAYINRCNQNNEFDNKEIVGKIASLRAEKASLLGYKSHADYVLEESMAKTPAQAYDLLNRLWKATLPIAKREALDMQNLINSDGKEEQLEAWDWFYYADKIRVEKYNYNAEELKSYFKLENVRDGIFAVAQKLYGLNFGEIASIPKYHEDVLAYEVTEENGNLVGVLYMDFYTRNSKRGGAWMTSYRRQSTKNGERIAPVISIVCNYPKPVNDQSVLLTPDEVETFFHEFGHALHGLLSNVEFESLSGTSVPRDFVELPSQIMEHWAFEKEVLNLYAKHEQTGKSIPADLVEKMEKASKFNQGFATIEYLAAAILDLSYHTIAVGEKIDVLAFEKEQMEKLELISQISPRYRSTYFQHIFSGGYSAGYYSYIWSEVLDSDGFAAFQETGNIFDPFVAKSFRQNILEKGATQEPMTLYKAFRGREPEVKFLLKNRGLENA